MTSSKLAIATISRFRLGLIMAVAATPKSARLSSFQGPCKDCCAPLAFCCISADGNTLCCCVLTQADYTLPLCLHTCLCPQQGCAPCPMERSANYTGYDEQRHSQYAQRHNVAANLCGMCFQNTPGTISFYACCWRWACGECMGCGCERACFGLCPCIVPCVALLVESR